MTNAQIFLILSAIYVASVIPKWARLAFGLIYGFAAIYLELK